MAALIPSGVHGLALVTLTSAPANAAADAAGESAVAGLDIGARAGAGHDVDVGIPGGMPSGSFIWAGYVRPERRCQA
jgi:hypothetical protein